MTRARLAALSGGIALALASSCTIDEIDLNNKKCPCTDGWVCDPVSQKCVLASSGGTGAKDGGGTGGKDGGGTGGKDGGGTGGTGAKDGGGGTGGVIDGGGGTGGLAGSAGCSFGTKLCNGACVSSLDPANGCNGPTCDPCPTGPNAQPSCLGGCSLTCDPGYGDCTADPGCETTVTADPNCGACNRTCSAQNASATACASGTCTPTCNAGFANCNEAQHPTPDDGCEAELATDTSHCGSCANSCTAQGGISSKFTCFSGQCGCSSTSQCESSGGINGASCNTATHTCVCSGASCRPGEVCGKQGGTSICRCNGGGACASTQVCCASGCASLSNDPQNCGVCGKACSTGQSCVGGICA